MANQKPVDEIRIGRVKATIWRNGTDEQPRHNVTFGRLYKEADQWKTTQSFGRNDLLVLAKVADQAHSRIFALPQEEQTEAEAERTRIRARRGPAPPRSELFPFYTSRLIGLDSQGSLQSSTWESSSATARLLRELLVACRSSGLAGSASQSTARARPGIPPLAESVTRVDSSGPCRRRSFSLFRFVGFLSPL